MRHRLHDDILRVHRDLSKIVGDRAARRIANQFGGIRLYTLADLEFAEAAARARKLLLEGRTVTEVSKTVGIHRVTLQEWLRSGYASRPKKRRRPAKM